MTTISEYKNGSREAVIQLTENGYEVELFDWNELREVRKLHDKTLRYAEDLAENWVEGIIE